MLIMLNEKNSWGHPTCKNIHTYINIVCLNIYKISMHTQFFFSVHRRRQFFLPVWFATHISLHHPDGGLAKNADPWVPPLTNWIRDSGITAQGFLPTYTPLSTHVLPCPPTYYLDWYWLTPSSEHHWVRSSCSQGGRIMSNHLLSGILKKDYLPSVCCFL